MQKRKRLTCAIALGLVATAAALFGQGNTGSIVGTVTDPSGAVMPGVELTITNLDTGVSTPAKSDSAGAFAARYIVAGGYRLQATAKGFKQYLRDDIVLGIGRELRVDIGMTTGTIADSITVSAQSQLVETETGALSANLTTKTITSLPSFRRNIYDYSALMPGMATGAYSSAAQENPSANGGTMGKDPVFLDGAYSSLTVNTGTSTRPNPDVIADVKVIINSFDAQFGDTSGSVTVINSKSGTNEYHGDLYYFFQNSDLNAGNYFTHLVTQIHYNEFGGVIGGPIKKNKTFIFFGYRQFRSFGTTQWTNLSLPDANFRNGNFAELLGATPAGNDALGRPVYANQVFDPASGRTVNNVVVRDPFPNNAIPTSRMSPAALKLQALYPAPQLASIYNNYNSNGPAIAIETQYDGRLDHNFNDTNKVMLKYSKRLQDNRPSFPFPNDRIAGGSSSGGTANWKRPDHTITLNYVRIFTPTITNDLHLNWFQVYAKREPDGFGTVGYQTYGIMGMPAANQTQGVPRINITNINSLGAVGGTLWLELQGARSLVDQLAIAKGKHTIKIGGEIRFIRTDNYQPNPNSGQFTFANTFTNQVGFNSSGVAYASFLLGLPTAFNYTIYPDYFRSRASVFAAYVQDDIRVSKQLTVNLGVRWDDPNQFHERDNLSGVFNLNTGLYQQFGKNGFRTTAWPNTYTDVGPRVGFAYSPFKDSKTVIRGGFGFFTIGTQLSGATGNMPNTPIFADTDTGRYTTTDNVNWPTTLDYIAYAPASKTGANGALSVGIYPDYNPMSYKLQWNLSASHDFRGYLVEAGYVGDRGVHLASGSYNMNAIPLALAPLAQGHKIAPYIAYPLYPNGVTVNDWIGSSHLEELVSKVEKRYGGGFSMLTAFTWQKPMATTGGYRDPVGNRNLEAGISGSGNKLRLTSAFTYEFPLGKGRHWAGKSPLAIPLRDWEINGIVTMLSGGWLTPGLNSDNIQNGGSDYPNVVPGQNPNLPRSQRTNNHWFNTAAFSVPANWVAGNAGHSLFLGPGVANFDLSLGRRFTGFGNEKRQLEFRGEVYNAPNRPIMGNPNTTVGNPNYGIITSANQPRTMQLGLKFYF
jgi:hypothetical protein